MWPRQQFLYHSLFSTHSSGLLVLLYKAEAVAQATLMQTEALQHHLCSSVML